MWAASLGSDNIMTDNIAGDLGMLSGGSAVLAQTPELAVQLSNDPVGYLDNMKNLGSSIAANPGLLSQMIGSIPQAIKDQEEMDNTYDANSAIHESYSTGITSATCR